MAAAKKSSLENVEKIKVYSCLSPKKNDEDIPFQVHT